MKITVGRLRQLFQQGLAEAGKVGASAAYLEKERVREHLQALVKQDVASGKIADQAGLDDFFNSVAMASSALKMVPYDVWSRMK